MHHIDGGARVDCRWRIDSLLQQGEFGPEERECLSIACDLALTRLNLKVGDHASVAKIIKLIVEAAQGGENDPNALCALALNRFKWTNRKTS